MKLKQRMLIVILGSFFIILAGLLTYVGVNNNRSAVDTATFSAATSGEKIAVTVQKDIEVGMIKARSLSASLDAMKNDNITSRNLVNTMLKRTLEANPTFVATWTVWEPNAFDGMDHKFANTEGTDKTGRLISYWSTSGSTISLTALTGYDQSGSGDYYLFA